MIDSPTRCNKVRNEGCRSEPGTTIIIHVLYEHFEINAVFLFLTMVEEVPKNGGRKQLF